MAYTGVWKRLGGLCTFLITIAVAPVAQAVTYTDSDAGSIPNFHDNPNSFGYVPKPDDYIGHYGDQSKIKKIRYGNDLPCSRYNRTCTRSAFREGSTSSSSRYSPPQRTPTTGRRFTLKRIEPLGRNS